MPKLSPRQFGGDGEPTNGGSKKGPKGPKSSRTDSDKAAHRALKALRMHQTAHHLGEKNEYGQRTINQSKVASCSTCAKLQADYNTAKNN